VADSREPIRIGRDAEGAWVVSYGEKDERRYASRGEAVRAAQEAAREDGRPVVIDLE
jgi:hypothetical protein